MRTIYALDRQTIMDIAIQYYGSAASLSDLCNDNGWDYDQDLQAGDAILIQDTYPASADGDVADYLQGNNVVVISLGEQNNSVALGTNDGQYIITNDDEYISN